MALRDPALFGCIAATLEHQKPAKTQGTAGSALTSTPLRNISGVHSHRTLLGGQAGQRPKPTLRSGSCANQSPHLVS